MRASLRRLGQLCFALVTVAVLGFGASEAVSSPALATGSEIHRSADFCDPDIHIGTCSSDEECDEMCEEAGYPLGGDCNEGCCACFE